MQAYFTKRNLLIAAGVAAGIVLTMMIRVLRTHPRAVASKPTAPVVTVQEIVAKDLEWANQLSGTGIDRELMSPVRGLFAQGRKGSHAFADEVLGLRSKWYLTRDYITRGHTHAAFLREEFSKYIFAPQQLQKAVEAVVSAYMRHLEDVDSQLLVRLEADLSGIPAEQFTPGIDRGAIRKIVDEALRQAREASVADFKGAVGTQIASFIAGEVLTMATVQLATSAGILTAGAVSGPWTFGIGIVIGFAADVAVTHAYDKLYDPVGKLTKQVNSQLDQLERAILVGSDKGPGLDQRLRDYSLRRSQAREAAIQGAILHPMQSVAL
jgi:hypothetical protein